MSINSSIILRSITKHLIVLIGAVILGMGIGIGQGHAESKTVNVPGIGNVGTAETTGNSNGAKGRSTSTTTLFYLRAHIKIWHTGNILQAQNNKNWYYSKGSWTNNISSSGYGDYAVTLHTFQFVSSPYPSTTVYSSQGGGWSCAAAWNQFHSPC